MSLEHPESARRTPLEGRAEAAGNNALRFDAYAGMRGLSRQTGFGSPDAQAFAGLELTDNGRVVASDRVEPLRQVHLGADGSIAELNGVRISRDGRLTGADGRPLPTSAEGKVLGPDGKPLPIDNQTIITGAHGEQMRMNAAGRIVDAQTGRVIGDRAQPHAQREVQRPGRHGGGRRSGRHRRRGRRGRSSRGHGANGRRSSGGAHGAHGRRSAGGGHGARHENRAHVGPGSPAADRSRRGAAETAPRKPPVNPLELKKKSAAEKPSAANPHQTDTPETFNI